MTSTRKWALALCLALSCLRYSNAQDITGNLSDPWAWQNAGQIGVPITCMAPGQPGYCGPNPSVGGFGDPGGINFSYGMTDLYQSFNVANVLPYSGTGLIITGFNFGFTAKNGNGWDGGGLDTLSAYVNFYNKGGATVESYNYNLNYVFNWTTFNYNETFANPYRINQISTARFGFVGQDNNYWAGFYGPEIYNVSFSLKYAPDPCVINPLSSPSCPGFSSALASRTTTPSTTAVIENTDTTQSISSTTPTALVNPLSTANILANRLTSGTSTPTSAIDRPSLVSPRTQAIVRSINESAISTTQTSIQQSQEQGQNQSLGLTGSLNPILDVANTTRSSDSVVSENPAASFTRPGDPVASSRGLITVVPQDIAPEPKTVPKNIQPHAELSGGASITALQTGADITSYTMAVMQDAAFYPPREIYRDQRTVDNRRALQGLGSDARYQEMINQQYGK